MPPELHPAGAGEEKRVEEKHSARRRQAGEEKHWALERGARWRPYAVP